MPGIYKVNFEIMKGLFFFHPFCIVEAKDETHAKKRAMQVMNSHPDNVSIKKQITHIEKVDALKYPNYIKIEEVMPWQPHEDETGGH